MNASDWYQTLIKPSWAPPNWVFGPAWTFLYTIIFISFGFVFYQAYLGKLNFSSILPFLLNLIFNFSFTYFQFGLRNNLLASIDIILILSTLIWALLSIFPHYRWVAFINIPYLLWVTFATCLQLTITYLNW